MSILILNHKVKDFKVWRPYFDADQARRAEAGLKELHVGTKEDDPQEVYMIFETQDVARAKQMMENPEIHKIMEQAGVTSKPTITVLKEQ